MKTGRLLEKVRITYEFFFRGKGAMPFVCSKQFELKSEQKLTQTQEIQQNEEFTFGVGDSVFKDQSTEVSVEPIVHITKKQIN